MLNGFENRCRLKIKIPFINKMMKEIKASPLVSVIAVCHKQAPFVVETLESIRNQSYSNIELIIINNVKDECESIIQNWIKGYDLKCFFIQNEQPKTVTQNCNIGLSNCNGKYFQTISCDDVLLIQKIEKQVEVFENLDESYACVYSDEERITENGEIIVTETMFQERLRKYNLIRMPKGNLILYFSEVAFISPVSTLHRTKIIKQLNGFDEDFLIEDWPLYLKLSKNNYCFDYVDEVLVQYRVLSNSLSHARTWKYHLEHLRIYSKYADILIKNSRTSIKIRFYLLDVAKISFGNFIEYYFKLFRFLPKDLKSNLKFLKAAIYKK